MVDESDKPTGVKPEQAHEVSERYVQEHRLKFRPHFNVNAKLAILIQRIGLAVEDHRRV
jgi:hypothetical protein